MSGYFVLIFKLEHVAQLKDNFLERIEIVENKVARILKSWNREFPHISNQKNAQLDEGFIKYGNDSPLKDPISIFKTNILDDEEFKPKLKLMKSQGST